MTNIIRNMRKRKPRKHQQFRFMGRKQVIHNPDESEQLIRDWLSTHEPTKLPAGWSRMGFAPG